MNSTSKNNGFIAYEYKDVNVKRDYAAMYEDCYRNFGWTLIEQHEFGVHVAPDVANITGMVSAPHVSVQTARHAEVDIVTLKFKRDRKLSNKQKLDALQVQCEDALAAIDRLRKKEAARSMGASLGLGIMGAGFITFAVYNFISASTALGVVYAVIGGSGWLAGFLANSKLGGKNKAQTEPMIQSYFETIHGACEQAYGLLA